MVDCGNIRCVQERKSFKKELLSWSKKVPIAVGLERIAEELGGQAHIKELLLPFNDLETDEIEDWEPDRKCSFCESRVQLVFEAVEQLIDEAKNGKGVQDNASMRYLQEILPYCPQFYTQNMGRELLAELKSSGQNVENSEPDTNVPQQPSLVELKIPHIVTQASKHKKENIPNCKKNYTDDELTEAVSEIQNGKLGTRRASALYGIPRSTLRNKIFKMDADKLTLLHEDGLDDEDSQESGIKWSELIQGNLLPLALPQLPPTLPCDLKETKKVETDENTERKLDTIRKKHNLSGKEELYYEMYEHELKMPILKDIIRKLAEERLEMERNASRVRVLKHDEITLDGLGSLKRPSVGRTDEGSEPPIPSYQDIIIPSYKSTRSPIKQEHAFTSSLDKLENSAIGDTLKEIIMKTISEKVKCKSHQVGDLVLHKSHHQTFQPNGASPAKQIKKEDHDKKKGSVDSPGTPAKKTRPKRGQYRKYNSQLLMEAVKAVQRGEMSVHRAGSYYGVPHSTLEYKVKERHLLRQKKIKEQQQQKEAASASAATTAKKTSASVDVGVTGSSSGRSGQGSKATHSVKEEVSKKLETPEKMEGSCPSWYTSYLVGASHLDGSPGLGFPSGFALNTPASELLRKLQHKVQSKSDSYAEDSNYSKRGVGALGDGYFYIN
ncbi:mushroom body large-type Kenyon cell-specific protein 1-like [Mizuhopecten yessoensis]|uniref:Mushroom body large-type Kenyon cell-specific protein 1 n=1 Tax=Mizuhopecten yessoensis TaxID=6573 RepID=A0A210QSQ3_MIZYE|nr:mushroom body large-type Kenyon cell-specific protein 1-like [Mizuhopecten yessoensis]OWF51764.1 Mushroom body large-type Kenyon cell-specific protein 1 [Mizuhopecten yessoensis]